MPIVSSSYQLDNHTQHDGRIYVYETHIDDNGNTYPWDYLAPLHTDYNKVLSEHADILNNQLMQMVEGEE